MKIEVSGGSVFPGAFLEREANCFNKSAESDSSSAVALIANCAASERELHEAFERLGHNLHSVVAISSVEIPPTEKTVTSLALDAGVPLLVLRCAPVVGTGMTGRWRDMLNAIYRGIYAHIKGNNARASLIHAIDVARVAVKAIGLDGCYYLSDARTPTVDNIAEALSRRLADKRIPVVSPRQARITAGLLDFFTVGHAGARARMAKDTTNSIIDPSPLLNLLSYTPIDTVKYISEHVYTDEDI